MGEAKSSEKNWVKDQLTMWGLEELHERFQDQGIDKETFMSMPSEAVTELISKIGPRYIFLKKRTELKQLEDFASATTASTLSVDSSMDLNTVDDLDDPIPIPTVAVPNSPHVVDCSESSDASSSSINSIQATGQKLRHLLNKTLTGKTLLKTIQLTPLDRKKLSSIIIDHLLDIKLKITTNTLQFWAAEIESVFQYERRATYFVPYQGGADKRAASGKLWDKYANTKRYLKKNILPVAANQTVQITEDKDRQKYLLQLRTVSPEDLDLARTLWEKTYLIREKTLSIPTYYQEYPILATPIGSSLLQLDFELSNVCSDPEAFLKEWPAVAATIVEIAKSKHLPSLNLEELTDDVQIETAGLLILPYLFRPSLVKTGDKKKKWKPSIQEQADGFICRIATITELETVLSKRKENLLTYGLTFQPLIVVVGDPKNFSAIYVIINEAKYTASNLMGAVDMCFKIHYALDAKYSPESEIVWVFLQQFLYGIEGSRNYITTSTVWSDIMTHQKLKEKFVTDV